MFYKLKVMNTFYQMEFKLALEPKYNFINKFLNNNF